MDTTKRSRISQLLGTLANVQGHEIKAVVGSFLFVVLLMSAYYILRPVRDAMASDWSDAEVSWLWTLNFFISTGVVALYGALVARFPLRLLVPRHLRDFRAHVLNFLCAGTQHQRSGADRQIVLCLGQRL